VGKSKSELKDTSDTITESFVEELLLALEVRETELMIWLVNTTRSKVLFSVNTLISGRIQGITSGTLKNSDYAKIDCWDMRSRETWPSLIMDIVFFNERIDSYRPPLSERIQITDKLLKKKSSRIPFLKSKGILLNLLNTTVMVDPVKLQESFFEGTTPVSGIDPVPLPNDYEVDLHIESFHTHPENISQQDILNIQLAHFEKKLEEAVINNANSVTFIHGVGNGTLRYQIHKKLSQYPHIKYFEDAQKEKFGYGATKVHLK
jgi:hypothetical protein